MSYFKFVRLLKGKLALAAVFMIAVGSLSFSLPARAMWEEAENEPIRFDDQGALIAAPVNVIFPDEELAMAIALELDMDTDEVVSLDDLKQIKKLILSGNDNIKALDGIEHLTELEVLICNNNLLEKLDVSKNKKLVELRCVHNELHSLKMDNPNLKVLNVTNNKLTEIDTTKLPALVDLNVSLNQLTSLNLKENPELKNIRGLGNYGMTVADVHPKVNIAGEKIHFNFSPKSYDVVDNMMLFK
ncbi:leucine-rich repeat domain-containing protein [Listeria costaricensis]|uniref:leucine-rich repeat domain-containing protein n=1 Tax=Listeria costaricensis TaxID=2026604 RepID=UPI000C06D945|nr:leucine-rich repeat domain-containing protein [Listeria costaricensis]